LAADFYRKQRGLRAHLRIQDGLQRSYGNQALILKAWGRSVLSADHQGAVVQQQLRAAVLPDVGEFIAALNHLGFAPASSNFSVI
jgi:hypothetical protein